MAASLPSLSRHDRPNQPINYFLRRAQPLCLARTGHTVNYRPKWDGGPDSVLESACLRVSILMDVKSRSWQNESWPIR